MKVFFLKSQTSKKPIANSIELGRQLRQERKTIEGINDSKRADQEGCIFGEENDCVLSQFVCACEVLLILLEQPTNQITETPANLVMRSPAMILRVLGLVNIF